MTGRVLNLSIGVFTRVMMDRAQAIAPEVGGMFLGMGGASFESSKS
jgi:hypothetical protein